MLTLSLDDLRRSVLAWRLWALLGWLEIRQRYARSIIGPFWLTISMAVMLGALGIVYGALFGIVLKNYLPYLGAGLISWAFFSQIVNEGATAYINGASYMKQTATPKLIFIFQVIWRNLIILIHNFILIAILLAIYGTKNWSTLPLIIPGIFFITLNAMWIAMIGALLSARFRDFPQIVSSIIQVLFYVTPIVFKGDSLKRFDWIISYNPISYLINLIREPVLGIAPSLQSWVVALTMAMAGWGVALILTERYLKRIPYWV